MVSLEIPYFHIHHLGPYASLRLYILKMAPQGALTLLYLCVLWSLDLNVFALISIHSYSCPH